MLPSWSGEEAPGAMDGSRQRSATNDQLLEQGSGSGLMPTCSKWSRTLLSSIICPPILQQNPSFPLETHIA